MESPLTVKQFRRIIDKLPSDPEVKHPRHWYLSQKQHWLGWLGQYDGPGAYDRKTGVQRDARFAYNHIVCPDMLIYLIHAAEMPPEIISAAENAYQQGSSLMQKAGAIRKIVPWSDMEKALLEWNESHAIKPLWKRWGRRDRN